jgi:predicted metalloprotease
MALIAIFVFKKDPVQTLSNLATQTAQQQSVGPGREFTPEEQALQEHVEKVLTLTEDVWDEIYPYAAEKFRGQPGQYVKPKLVSFSGRIKTACGLADAGMGPFYCPGDQQVYIDLAFYDELKKKFKAPGDFAQAYVIAHEVGHHVQKLLGFSDFVNQKRRELGPEEFNKYSVKLELQADYFAGVWANRAQQKWQVLERGDLEEGIRAAGAVGDDTIQKRAQGYAVPESFTHGTAEQRIKWFTLGLESGDPRAYNPFDVAYEDL